MFDWKQIMSMEALMLEVPRMTMTVEAEVIKAADISPEEIEETQK